MTILSEIDVQTYQDHIKRKLDLATAAELRKYAVEWEKVAD